MPRILPPILVSCLLAATCPADPRPADRPSNGWDPSWFAYERPAELVLVESTPRPEQIGRLRPASIPQERELAPDGEPAKPLLVQGMHVVHLQYRNNEGEIVPALLCTPPDQQGPFPVVIAVHGLRSNKAQVCGQVAPALVKRGFAVLAPDMPLHGERPGNPRVIGDAAQAGRTVELYRQAVRDVRLTIDVAELREQLDTSSVTLLGYSMGSWINSVAGAADPRVKQMVLMVGGAHDIAAAAMLIPQIAAAQPHLAIANFAGELLMLNARHDHIVTPAMAERLYNAAQDPKEQIWFESGHILPPAAYEQAAEWLAERLKPADATQ